MSDDQETPDPKVTTDPKTPRPRRIVRSASTAARPAFEPGSADSLGKPESPSKPDASPAEGAGFDLPAAGVAPAEGGAASPRPQAPPADAGRRWDVRAERSGGPDARPGPRRPQRAQFAPEPGRRPGTSGGRAAPMMNRGPVDRSSPEFVDKWLSSPPRKIEDRPDRRDDRRPPPGSGPPGSQGHGDRPARRDARPDARSADLRPKRVVEAPPPAKLPTLHETILVGLPKVAVDHREKSEHKPKTAKEALAAKTAATPKKRKSEPPKAAPKVDPTWVGIDASNAVATLGKSGGAAEALVDAWITSGNAAAIAECAASEALTGASRKAARRALSVLKSRGIAVPEPTTAAAPRGTEEEVVVDATFSPPDARGTMSMTIARRKGGERAHIAEVILRDGVGIVNAVSGWMSRSQIKEAHQRIAESTGVQPAAVSPEWARWRIQKALQDNATSGQLVPLGLDKCKDLVEPAPVDVPAHPVADLEATLGDAAAGASASLHGEPELRAWIPDSAALDGLLRGVGQRLTGDDASDPAKVDAALKEEMQAATTRFFDEKQRQTVARRLRDVAVTVRQRAGDARAKEILEAARTVEKTSAPGDVDFLRAFFQKGIAALAQQGGGQLRLPRS